MARAKNKNDYLRKVFLEIDKVKDNDRIIMLIAHGFLELLINTLVGKKCQNHKKILEYRSEFSYSAKLILLNEMGYINRKEFRILDRFRKIRNEAAHEPIFKLSRSDIEYFSEFNPPSEDIVLLCKRIIIIIWNKYNLVFYPIFG